MCREVGKRGGWEEVQTVLGSHSVSCIVGPRGCEAQWENILYLPQPCSLHPSCQRQTEVLELDFKILGAQNINSVLDPFPSMGVLAAAPKPN